MAGLSYLSMHCVSYPYPYPSLTIFIGTIDGFRPEGAYTKKECQEKMLGRNRSAPTAGRSLLVSTM